MKKPKMGSGKQFKMNEKKVGKEDKMSKDQPRAPKPKGKK